MNRPNDSSEDINDDDYESNPPTRSTGLKRNSSFLNMVNSIVAKWTRSINNSSSSAPRKEGNNQARNPDVATVHSNTSTKKNKSFQEQLLELMDYKSEYGHCMLPSTKNGHTTLSVRGAMK